MHLNKAIRLPVRTVCGLGSTSADVLKIGHTWSHSHLTQLNEAQIDREIQRLDEAFVKILGVKPKFFRCALKYAYYFPYRVYTNPALYIALRMATSTNAPRRTSNPPTARLSSVGT
jgi:Polysaccharide deacetylase